MPPGDLRSSRRSQFLARAAGLELRALFPRASPRLLAGFGALAQRHPQRSHWYLAFIGVEPRWQRHGFGRALLAPALAKADAADIPCYLETPFPETRAFYVRLGFKDAELLRPVEGAPPIWTMTRAAARSN